LVRQKHLFFLILIKSLYTLQNFSTNKTDLHDITEILLKVALNTITLTPIQFKILQTSISAINVIRLFLSPWYLYTCTCTFFVCQYYQQFFLIFRKFCKVYNDFIKIRKNKCFCLVIGTDTIQQPMEFYSLKTYNFIDHGLV
jgi:hypothetical protein